MAEADLTYDAPNDVKKDIPRLTPAFGNTGTAEASGTQGCKESAARGSGPALGLVPVGIDTLKGGPRWASPQGDPDPANNTAPIKVGITGTAPPGETDPPGEPAPPGEAGPGPANALAVAVTAAVPACVTVLVTRRRRTR